MQRSFAPRRGLGLGVLTIGLAITAGCGGSRSSDPNVATRPDTTSSPPTTTTTNPRAPSELEVVAFTPDATEAVNATHLSVTFSSAVDPATLVHDGTAASTLVVVEDVDPNPGGRLAPIVGTATLDASGTVLTWAPPAPFRADHEVRLILTSGIRDAGGRSLEGSAASSALSFGDSIADGVFEGRFRPEASPAAAPPPAVAAVVASATTDFHVIDVTPSLDTRPVNVTEIRITFSRPVNTRTARGPTEASPTFSFLQDTNTTAGGSYGLLRGQLLWANGYRTMIVRMTSALPVGRQILVALMSGLRDIDGRSLTRGSISGPLSARSVYRDQVWETRFTPASRSAPAPAPTPTPTPTPAPAPTPTPTASVPNPSSFTYESGTDVWHVDFALRAQAFSNDVARHGLRSGSSAVDDPARRRIIHQALATVSTKFRRSEAGRRVSGRSFAISFGIDRPSSGRPGWNYSRMAMGGSSGSSSTLGTAYLDPGNRRREDNARSGLGVFTQHIYGRQSRLYTALRSSDRRYVDGTYRLGDGSRSDDQRFRSIRTVIADWGQAIGTILAHEVGHSVGLDHNNSGRNIMNSSASAYLLSDPNAAFASSDLNRLSNNLGIQR